MQTTSTDPNNEFCLSNDLLQLLTRAGVQMKVHFDAGKPSELVWYMLGYENLYYFASGVWSWAIEQPTINRPRNANEIKSERELSDFLEGTAMGNAIFMYKLNVFADALHD